MTLEQLLALRLERLELLSWRGSAGPKLPFYKLLQALDLEGTSRGGREIWKDAAKRTTALTGLPREQVSKLLDTIPRRHRSPMDELTVDASAMPICALLVCGDGYERLLSQCFSSLTQLARKCRSSETVDLLERERERVEARRPLTDPSRADGFLFWTGPLIGSRCVRLAMRDEDEGEYLASVRDILDALGLPQAWSAGLRAEAEKCSRRASLLGAKPGRLRFLRAPDGISKEPFCNKTFWNSLLFSVLWRTTTARRQLQALAMVLEAHLFDAPDARVPATLFPGTPSSTGDDTSSLQFF